MKVVATMPVRNEARFLELTVPALLMWADHVVMLDHASTDASLAIAERLASRFTGRITLLQNMDPTWHEMAHRQQLLDASRAQGATHIAIVDADELLTGNLLWKIRSELEQLGPGDVLQLPWVCLATGRPGHYFSSGAWHNNWASMGFADAPICHWSSEERDGYDFHHRHPLGSKINWREGCQDIEHHSGGLLHLQFLDGRRLRAKQALYKLTEVLRWPGREPVSVVDARYNLAVRDSATAAIAEINPTWLAPYEGVPLHDEEPWQEAEVRRLIELHGRDRFAGLDLFGL